jgi:hypothetical protein
MPDDHTIVDTLDGNDSNSYKLREMRTETVKQLELLYL